MVPVKFISAWKPLKETWSLLLPPPAFYKWRVLTLKGKSLSRVTGSQKRGWAKSQRCWVPGALPSTVPLPHSLVSELLPHASVWDNRKTQASAPNNLNGRVPWKSNQVKQEKSPERVCGRCAWTLTMVDTAPFRFSCFKLAREIFIFFNHGLLICYIVIYDYLYS